MKAGCGTGSGEREIHTHLLGIQIPPKFLLKTLPHLLAGHGRKVGGLKDVIDDPGVQSQLLGVDCPGRLVYSRSKVYGIRAWDAGAVGVY